MKFEDINETIGDTPLVKIGKEVTGLENIDVYAKLEYQNPYGSIKDRAAYYMLKDHIEEIKDSHKDIIELSSGNTAKALASYAGQHETDTKVVTNRIRVDEIKDILITMGVKIEELPAKSDCPDPNDPNNPHTRIDEIKSNHPDKFFHPDQYRNDRNRVAHYEETGEEILDDLENIDYFFGGLGTTGSTSGVADKIRERDSEMDLIGIVAAPENYIPAIRDSQEMMEVGLFDRDKYDDIVEITEEETIDGMLNLIREAGIMGGPTTGANFKATIKKLRKIDDEVEDLNAVFFACDRFEHYMSYLKKRRPEMYGMNDESERLHSLSEEEISETPSLSPEETEDLIEENPLVIDTRSNKAFKVAHIPGSINIPEDHMEELTEFYDPFPADKKILFVCPIGEKSEKLAAIARRNDSEAYSLKSGITAWRDAGKPLERS